MDNKSVPCSQRWRCLIPEIILILNQFAVSGNDDDAGGGGSTKDASCDKMEMAMEVSGIVFQDDFSITIKASLAISQIKLSSIAISTFTSFQDLSFRGSLLTIPLMPLSYFMIFNAPKLLY